MASCLQHVQQLSTSYRSTLPGFAFFRADLSIGRILSNRSRAISLGYVLRMALCLEDYYAFSISKRSWTGSKLKRRLWVESSSLQHARKFRMGFPWPFPTALYAFEPPC
jgi:hypothetical protein